MPAIDVGRVGSRGVLVTMVREPAREVDVRKGRKARRRGSIQKLGKGYEGGRSGRRARSPDGKVAAALTDPP